MRYSERIRYVQIILFLMCRDAALGITISSKENEEKIKQYRDGKLDVLINVNILTEGTDLPQTHTVFLTRPTISRVFMTQMVGRALRGEKGWWYNRCIYCSIYR